jgi:Trk K+ transport system NAD-binding subunit
MPRSSRRLLALMAGLVAFTIGSALLYQLGMARLEGQPRTFWRSIEWAAETLSTTGYGADARWDHPVMVLFVVIVQFVGVFLIFLIVPIFLVPFMEERFEEKLPRAAPDKLTDHVVVYRYGPAVETLLTRLSENGIATLVIERDEASARAVKERNQAVVFVRTEEDALEVCRLASARALVANGRDEENAALVLRARQMGFRGDVLAFVEEPAHRKPMELAGASAAYTPRHIVAAALAAHASERISPRLPGIDLIDGLRRCELRIPPSSPFAGKTLRDAALGSVGAVVVGKWTRNRLEARCTADLTLNASDILELVGDPDALTAAAERLGAVAMRSAGPFLIAGFGEVGRKVHELLTDAGEEVRVIERRSGPGVDVVGNVLDSSVLERAGVTTARAVVLALDSDDATMFGAVIVRDLVTGVPLIARVNHARNLDNIYRAGADYALSISDISGEMLTARLLRRKARARDEHRQVGPMRAHRYAGRRVDDLPLREHGCSLVAIRRGPAFLTRITADTTITPTDELFVCGGTDALHKVM